MTTEPRRFRVIQDTCDIVRSEPTREVWSESEVPKHSIFDQRHLSKHLSLTQEDRIRKPSEPKKEEARKHRTLAEVEACVECKGMGQIFIQISPEIIAIRPCKACSSTGMQKKPVSKPSKKLESQKIYSYRRFQQHRSQGDPCTLCGQLEAEHRPDRARMKKEREGK